MWKGRERETRARQLQERQTSHLEPHHDKGRGPSKTGMFIRHEVGVGTEPTGPTPISDSAHSKPSHGSQFLKVEP